jgi:hypothetical protein
VTKKYEILLKIYCNFILKNNNNKYKFYAHNEFDSNLTDFEALSDERRIILKTKLTDKEDITVIFKIFHGIFGNIVIANLNSTFKINFINLSATGRSGCIFDFRI